MDSGMSCLHHLHTPGYDLDLPCRKGARPIEFVTRDHDRRTGSRRCPENSIEFVSAARVETCMGFVEKPQLGSSRNETCEGHTTLLTGGQRRNLQLGQSAIETQSDDRSVDVDFAGSCQPAPVSNVPDDREICVQTVVVREVSDSALDTVAFEDEITPEDRTGAALDRQESCTHLEQTRLPRAIGTAQENDFTSFDSQVHSRKRWERPQHRDHIVETNDGVRT
jgi:hypothetical protein